MPHQRLHGVGELDLTAGTARLLGQKCKDLGLQDIAAGNEEVRGRLVTLGFFHHAIDGKAFVGAIAAHHHAIGGDILPGAFLDADDIAGPFLIGIHHLLEHAGLGLEDHVGEQQGEGLVTDNVARAPDGVAQAQRFLLAGEAGAAGRGQVLLQFFERLGLAAALQRRLELELAVEMVLDHALVAPGDEDEMLDTGLARLVHGVLDQRAVHHGQHFLGHGLGCRQETGSQTCDWKHGCTDTFGHAMLS
ncbi:hypothetical protein D3C86_1487740 [compost metagenome]